MIALMENTSYKSVEEYLEVGNGTHERFIIIEEKFQAKTNSKRQES